MLIPDLSLSVVLDSLNKLFQQVETEREERIHYLLDYFDGNVDAMEDDVNPYFNSQSLSQIPIFTQNLVKRMVEARALVYKARPIYRADEDYLRLSKDLPSASRQLEQYTTLLGTMGFRSDFDGNKMIYRPLHYFYPFFVAGDPNPVAIAYPQLNFSKDADNHKDMWVYWSKAIGDEPARHFLIDGSGAIHSVNQGDVNPYGILPFTFVSRSPNVRDFYSDGATDIVRANLHINIAITELALGIRFGAVGLKYITGVHEDEQITGGGVDEAIVLPPNTTMGQLNPPSGMLSEIVEATRFMVDTVASNNHLRIKWGDKSGDAPSAESLRVQEVENLETREASVEDTWRPFEAKRFEIDRTILAYHGIPISEDYSVNFSEPEAYQAPKERRENWDWLLEKGLITREDILKEINPDIEDSKLQSLLSTRPTGLFNVS